MSNGNRLNIDTGIIGKQLNRVSNRVQGFQNVTLTSRHTRTTLTANDNVETDHMDSQTIKQHLGTNIRDVLGISIDINTSFSSFENIMRRRNRGGTNR